MSQSNETNSLEASSADPNSYGSKSTRTSNRPSYLNRVARRLALFPFIAIAGLYLLSFTAAQPDNLGVVDGKLAKCPPTPNCVSTQSELESQAMDPIQYVGSSTKLLKKIKTIIDSKFSRATIVKESNVYLRYEFKSLIFRFIDDVEFMVDDEKSVVHFRSASRVGHSDLGANRKRMNKIVEGLK